MMAEDFDRIRGNVQKMIGMQAPPDDIDGYLQSEGLTPDQFKARVTQPAAPPQPAQPLAPGPFTQRTPDGRLITRPPTPQESKPMDWGAAANAAAAGAVDMGTFNQGNKLDAWLQSQTGIGGQKGDYEGNLARTNAARDAAQAKDPGAYAVGGAVGAYANPVNKIVGSGADKIITAAPRTGLVGAVARYGARMGQGGLTGGMYGAGFAPPGQAGEGAVKGAIGGAATAGVMQAAGDLAAPVMSRMAGKANPAMSEEQFKQAAQAAYKAVDESGVAIQPTAYQKFVADLPKELNGFHAKVTPGAANIISVLQDEASQGPVTLSTLDKLRSIAGGATVDANRNEARLALDITHKIDDFVDGLKAQDLVGGADNAEAAKASLDGARSAWRTYSKMKAVSDIVDTGENLNDQNWVKGRFRAIVKKPSLFNRYTDDEKDAIASIARTGTLEKIGKLIPWRGLQMSTTYAEPIAQDLKIKSLQDLIARGGKRPAQAAVFGSSPPAMLNAYGGLAAAQLGQRRPANGP